MKILQNLKNFWISKQSLYCAISALLGSAFGWSIVVMLSFNDSNAPDLNADIWTLTSVVLVAFGLARLFTELPE